MLRFNLKIGKEQKRLRIIRDKSRIDEEIFKYNFRRYEKSLLANRETDEERAERKKREEEEEKRRIEDEKRAERLKELEKKEAIITRFWNEFVITNEGKIVDLDLSKISEDTVPISVAKEEIQSAYERGMEDGQMQAMSTYKVEIAKYQDWIRKIDSVSQELTREHVQAITNFEENLIELSIMIAESILDERISEDKSAVVHQVRKAISSVHNEKIFRIHVNPELVTMLEEVKSTLLIDKLEANKIEIYPNPSVPVGGCLLETSGGMLDARVKNQLRKIYKELELENERVFNTKEIEEEYSNFYNEIDEQVKQNKEQNSDIPEDFSYDDMPDEYKEMFEEDIFGKEDYDLEGNLIIEEEAKEEISNEDDEIDYQQLYEEEIDTEEIIDDKDDTLDDENVFEDESNEEFDIDFEDDINESDAFEDNEETENQTEIDKKDEETDRNEDNNDNQFGLDDFDFDDEFKE